jgi:tellurite resistance-related uncharacterized protein
MKALPSSVEYYKSTPEFTETSVPAALRKDHTTAVGVWGKITVLEGSLEYCITEPSPEQHLLNSDMPGVVEPQMKHYVNITGPVRFRVDFYR